ncbi:MAG: CDP-alcohol phosphatidyltransferase family protein [Spirochaetia bacterium]|nr:CDP-alcohol phosphatidyltransferase family protein [Spirochaetia bacterium]
MKFMDVFRERFLTLSNLLSVLRILMIGPYFYVSTHYREDPTSLLWAGSVFGIIVFAVVSDFLDGFLARRWHQTTMLGRYLDPVSDKAVTISSLFILAFHYDFPFWVFIFQVLREILGSWMGWFLYFKRDMQGRPNQWGKWGVGVVALNVVWYMAQPLLALRFDPDHLIRHPEVAAYALAFVLAGGIFAYVRTYGGIILHGRNPRKNT